MIKDKLHKVLNHATVDDYEQIMDVFKQHKEMFPHIRGDKIKRTGENPHNAFFALWVF